MTGSQMISLVREYLNEAAITTESGGVVNQFYDDTRLLATMNLVYHNLNNRIRFNLDNTNVTVSGSAHNPILSDSDVGMVFLPSDFVKVDNRIGIRWYDSTGGYKDHRLSPTPFREAEFGNQQVYATGEPRWFNLYQECVFFYTAFSVYRVLEIFPAPHVAGLTALHVAYVARPADLTLTTSPVFATEFHPIIIHKTAEIYSVKKRNYKKARYHTVKYKELLDNMTVFYQEPERESGTIRRKSVYRSR